MRADVAPFRFRGLRSRFPALATFQRDDAQVALTQILSYNHNNHHCFHSDKGFHNHSIHQYLADFTLGATSQDLLEHEAYQKKYVMTPDFTLHDRSRFDPVISPASARQEGIQIISDDNWTHHLGRKDHYWAYLHFWEDKLAQTSVAQALHEFVFSEEANANNVHMIARFFGSVLHAQIHIGYGLEFDNLSIVAEGLAMASSTGAENLFLYPQEWIWPEATSVRNSTDLLSLMEEMLCEDRLSADNLGILAGNSASSVFAIGTENQALLHGYCERWNITTEAELDVEAALSQFASACALVLGATPRDSKTGEHLFDFILMHSNNAHLFSELYLDILKSDRFDYRRIYLQCMLRSFFWYWLGAGRPGFNAKKWHDENAKPPLEWRSIFDLSTRHPDEHMPKVIRTMYIFDRANRPHLLNGRRKLTAGIDVGDLPIYKLTAQLILRQTVQQAEHHRPGKFFGRGSHGSPGIYWNFEGWRAQGRFGELW